MPCIIMVFGLSTVLGWGSVYHGLRELYIFQYYAPAFSKPVKDYGGYERLRPRYPAPGSVDANKGFAARENRRSHHKTSYLFSRHFIRKFQDPKDDIETTIITNLIDYTKLTPEQEAITFRYVPGDAEGNARKKEKYIALIDSFKTPVNLAF